ncbi:hypothetical protein KXR87_18180 [Yokenella regensburgei]|uniref:hypothetical protein n=1 Tax=Yokenella regensburgei TaxID=158877 RepID=UPI003F168DAC
MTTYYILFGIDTKNQNYDVKVHTGYYWKNRGLSKIKLKIGYFLGGDQYVLIMMIKSIFLMPDLMERVTFIE